MNSLTESFSKSENWNFYQVWPADIPILLEKWGFKMGQILKVAFSKKWKIGILANFEQVKFYWIGWTWTWPSPWAKWRLKLENENNFEARMNNSDQSWNYWLGWTWQSPWATFRLKKESQDWKCQLSRSMYTNPIFYVKLNHEWQRQWK